MLWQNPIYPLATLLNPAYRTQWFKEASSHTKGETTRIQDGQTRANKIWVAWHQEQLEKDSQARFVETAKLTKRRRTTFQNPETIYDLNRAVFGDWNTKEVSEYDEYLSQAVILPPKGFMPLTWWCEESQHAKWPHLSALAVFILSFPAMSAEPERVFSGCKRTISWDRSSLSPELIEILECLKHRLRTQEELDISL